MTRREERETLFVLLFEASYAENPNADEIIRTTEEHMEVETDEYIALHLQKMLDSLDEIDEILKKFIIGRTLDRVSKAALTAMRIAVYEINNLDDVPTAAAINEAVELVKKYDMDDAASYANGVLGSYARSL